MHLCQGIQLGVVATLFLIFSLVGSIGRYVLMSFSLGQCMTIYTGSASSVSPCSDEKIFLGSEISGQGSVKPSLIFIQHRTKQMKKIEKQTHACNKRGFNKAESSKTYNNKSSDKITLHYNTVSDIAVKGKHTRNNYKDCGMSVGTWICPRINGEN